PDVVPTLDQPRLPTRRGTERGQGVPSVQDTRRGSRWEAYVRATTLDRAHRPRRVDHPPPLRSGEHLQRHPDRVVVHRRQHHVLLLQPDGSRNVVLPARQYRTPDSPDHPTHPFGPYPEQDRKSTRLNSSHVSISYAVFCLKKTRAEQ